MESTLRYTNGMAFEVSLDGHTFTIDAAPEHGGADQGPRPKGLLLSALAGCAGMDVISILTKMRQVPTSFSIRAGAELTEDHPKVFTDPIHLVVELAGELDPAKVWRAVALSRDRYCGVNAMLRKHAPIAVEVWINGARVDEPA
ncbi:MAG: OsmC family protein [Myxococcota bacterium]